MKPALKTPFKPAKPTTPKIRSSTEDKKPIKGLDISLMRRLAHNAVLWCDHDGGSIIDRDGNPFSAYLEMENTFDPERQKDYIKVFENYKGKNFLMMN